jgi:hypothetical protein
MTILVQTVVGRRAWATWRNGNVQRRDANRHRKQRHEGEPAQAAHFDEMAVRGPRTALDRRRCRARREKKRWDFVRTLPKITTLTAALSAHFLKASGSAGGLLLRDAVSLCIEATHLSEMPVARALCRSRDRRVWRIRRYAACRGVHACSSAPEPAVARNAMEYRSLGGCSATIVQNHFPPITKRGLDVCRNCH